MNEKEVNAAISAAWDRPDGILANIRDGHFSPQKADKFLEQLRQISIGSSEVISKSLVRLIWFIPLFLEWQTEAIAEQTDSIDAYKEFTNRAFDEVNRILGMP